MKDFPNYLLNKKEEKVISKSPKKIEQVWQSSIQKHSFQPSDVPSILKGLTRENRLDYTDIIASLRLNDTDFLLFSTEYYASDHQVDPIPRKKGVQPVIKRNGLHRSFQQLMAENEHTHFILSKGDTYER